MLTGECRPTGIMGCLAREMEGGLWYAVLDAAQDRYGPDRAEEAGLRVESLYAGEIGSLAAAAAPHLAAFELDTPFADWFVRSWGSHVGILLHSPADFAALRAHLRRFLTVRDESGKKYRFRFYDPRILRAFLPVCAPDELREFFGPIDRFYTPIADCPGLAVFSLQQGRLLSAIRPGTSV